MVTAPFVLPACPVNGATGLLGNTAVAFGDTAPDLLLPVFCGRLRQSAIRGVFFLFCSLDFGLRTEMPRK